ncbi:tRNA pseudouridine synthase 1 [Mycoemilia scoparia]|uniref:tRNA pseudouridine synthase 1 n=1 Tax=Mycoemilia scoparia TaxID=417184 RepID=A0A9W8DPM1_9FUNG|nr:tRNA pseudouridine synthase 1 [Mycoemilia scoparia]
MSNSPVKTTESVDNNQVDLDINANEGVDQTNLLKRTIESVDTDLKDQDISKDTVDTKHIKIDTEDSQKPTTLSEAATFPMDETLAQDEQLQKPAKDKKPKRKVALLLGYCGTGYQGMQINRDAKTIELELLNALSQSGGISKDNSTDLKKVGFQRAARTDKGVHAAGQVASLKMIIEDPDIIEKTNVFLPDQIRLWGYVRTPGSFNAKNSCDSRVYEYLLPTFVFSQTEKEKKLYQERKSKSVGEERWFAPSTAEELADKRKYRIDDELLQKVRQALKEYEGTFDYMNFTVTKGCNEKNSKRYIHYFEASDPFIKDGIEWVSLKVKGQSFMLHQIRKMVGLIILIMRTNTPFAVIKNIFKSPRINVPKAPSLGLLLEQPMFDAHNRFIKSQGKKIQYNDPITFEPYKEVIDAFKMKYIYSEIFNTELNDSVFDRWVGWCEVFPEQYSYLNETGDIPESAHITSTRSKEISECISKLAVECRDLSTGGYNPESDK